MFESAWLDSRIEAVKAQIEGLETAILALSTGRVQSYSFDSGQTRETVTKKDVGRLSADMDKLYSRLAALCAQKNGGSTHATPGW